MRKAFRAAGVCVAAALLLTSCAAYPDLQPANASVPRFIQLDQELSIATIHFPRGLYSLAGEDSRGYYYRSARRLVKHSFAGFSTYDGGIFLPNKSHNLRGYIVWAGGRSKIGDLSHARYSFRD